MITYLAEFNAFIEKFVNNDKDQGCDPDTMESYHIESVESDTLDGLIEVIKNHTDCKVWELFDINEESNRIESGMEYTDIRGIHYSVQVSAYISKVTHESVDLTEVKL